MAALAPDFSLLWKLRQVGNTELALGDHERTRVHVSHNHPAALSTITHGPGHGSPHPVHPYFLDATMFDIVPFLPFRHS